jgi:uncharacterized protein YcbX
LTVVTVSLLSVTPVKGLRLHNSDEIELTAAGAAGNRCFYLTNRAGRLFSGIAHGPLCRVVGGYDPETERLRLTFPDGAVAEGDATARGAEVETDFYGRRVRGRVVDGPFARALSAYVGRELRLVRPEQPGGAYDVHPVTLVSEASVEELRSRAGREEPLDGRRPLPAVEPAAASHGPAPGPGRAQRSMCSGSTLPCALVRGASRRTRSVPYCSHAFA